MAADVAFDLFCDESRHRDEVRCAFVVRVCAPILRNVPRPAVTEFFAAHIAYMIKSLTSKLNKVLTTKSSPLPQHVYRSVVIAFLLEF